MLDHALLPTLPQMVQVNYSQQAEIVSHLIDQAALTPEARAQISPVSYTHLRAHET